MRIQQDRRILVAGAVAAFLLVALIFFWIGWGSRPAPDYARERMLADRYLRLTRNSRFFEASSIWTEASVDRIANHLKFMSSEPHVSGKPEHSRTAEYFLEHFAKLKAFEVFTKEYQVPVGLPVGNSSFVIHYADGSNYTSQLQEAELANVSLTNQVTPILSFTPSGQLMNVTKVVYANYGTEADFLELLRLNVSLTGAIAVMRYGGAGRGKKLANAGKYGCVGGIVYSDPGNNWAQPGNLSESNVYPNAWWLPPTGVQRGSAKMTQADPQTPDYPSHRMAYRQSWEELKSQTNPRILSPIPGYPVGYGDAEILLRALAGPGTNGSFVGGLSNIKYFAGGILQANVTGVDLIVNNEIKENVEAKNIFALIKGEIEPDRYILLGNHRDAWGTGVVDASSGSSVFLELATVLNSMYERGWRPRRSILLCSWDVEEQGITGSWEWVEDKFGQIKDRVAAYVNVDIAARGNYVIRPNADPLMQQLVLDALKNVPLDSEDPRRSDEMLTLFDTYKKLWLDTDRTMTVPISGSDYSAFIQKAGVPVIDVSYVADPQVSTYYPLYHSLYETYYAMEKLIDPGMRAHREVTVWATELLRMLADSWLLRYDANALAKSLKSMYDNSQKPDAWKWPENQPESKKFVADVWQEMGTALERLTTLSANWTAEQNELAEQALDGSADPMLVRASNDAGMRLMQALTDYHGQTVDPTKHNFFFAARSAETLNGVSVGSSNFPGLADLLAADSSTVAWKSVCQHAAALLYRVTALGYQMETRL